MCECAHACKECFHICHSADIPLKNSHLRYSANALADDKRNQLFGHGVLNLPTPSAKVIKHLNWLAIVELTLSSLLYTCSIYSMRVN